MPPLTDPDTDRTSELRHWEIFEHTPLVLWEEDYTELLAQLEALVADGIVDLAAHFDEHPALLSRLVRTIQIVDANQAALEILGARNKRELIGSLGWVLAERSYAQLRQLILGLAHGQRDFAAEVEIRTLTGKPLFVHLTVTIVPQQNGAMRALVSMLDITERRQIEEALRLSEERYADLYDNAPDMFASLDPVTGTIVQCNQTMATSLELTEDELVGRSILTVIHPDHVAEVQRTLAALAEGDMGDMVECRYLRLRSQSGRLIETSLKISAVYDPGGRVSWYSAVWRDIGEQRRTEAELVDKETLYQTLTESIPHLVWMSDAEGRITYCNQAMVQLTGLTQEQICGRDWTDDVHPEDLRHIRALQEAARWNGSSYRGECRVLSADGGHRSVYFIVTAVKDEAGKVQHWVGVNTDITELKEAQEALQRALDQSNLELAQIAHAASHDLQEPLRMVTSYAQRLEQRYLGKLDERADKYIAYAVQGAKHIRKLIQDLLTLSRISTDAREPHPADSRKIVEQVLADVQRELTDSSAQIVLVGELPLILADAAQVTLLFEQLLANSLKFRSVAAPRIEISAQRHGAMWLFSIKDNGIGFDNAAYGERIFQMFQRLHPRGIYAGTGIGLTLAKKIVERHGGRIWADSVPGQGATFFFTLPAVAAELLEDKR